ncbi:MAG: hypothetical protein K2O00_04960 [Muribaculaceae bacterium]|nr:hypothetical protein [Muribaculaceae bacterium]
MNKITSAILFCLCALFAGSCSDTPVSESATLQDVVMIEQMGASSTTFAVALPGNPEIAHLRTNKVLNSEEVKVGDCCMIRYISPAEPYKSADIELLGCYTISGNLTAGIEATEMTPQYSDTPVYLLSAWSFCNRIILRMQLPYPANNRKLLLQLDPTTIDDEIPTLRLIQHIPGNTDSSYMGSYTVAFSLDEINAKKSWKGVKILLNNSNLKKNVVNLTL